MLLWKAKILKIFDFGGFGAGNPVLGNLGPKHVLEHISGQINDSGAIEDSLKAYWKYASIKSKKKSKILILGALGPENRFWAIWAQNTFWDISRVKLMIQVQ